VALVLLDDGSIGGPQLDGTAAPGEARRRRRGAPRRGHRSLAASQRSTREDPGAAAAS